MRILICDPIAEQGIAWLEKEKDFQVDVRLRQTEEEIIAAVGQYQALIVRSETRITKGIIEAAPLLKVIGRAGVGVDNIDVPAATKQGVIVINAPDGNTISACEHTMALILSLARYVPQADQSLRRQLWDRKKFTGIELRGRVIGILGFGKIGAEIAARCKAFGMKVLAYDPYVTQERAARFNVELRDKEGIFREADFITVHMPLTDETRDMIAKKQLAMMKPTARVINVARGGIVNENDLYEAVRDGVIAGAAVDVWLKEPVTEHPLFTLPQMVVTPHLGASTEEAQVNVALDVAEEIARVLRGLPVHNAVNIPFINPEAMERARPYMELAEKLGKMAAYLSEGPVKEAGITYLGDFNTLELKPLTNTFLKGLLRPILNDAVNYVNAPVVAKERGIQVVSQQNAESADYVNKLLVSVKSDGGRHTLAGTVFQNGEAHILAIDDFILDIRPAGHLMLVPHKDQPKVVGQVGMILGDNDVNIGGMQVGRREQGGTSLMVLNVDHPVSDAVLKEVERLPGVHKAAYLHFD
ncbi:MAG: phosphoglycerate dehydrogenase [Peptococcaceae bacterium]|jgi:D-3-phosphoglycerate dehydrogenase|nr:phosphoglycerate dehydrogenase [Peptococcaceae bacterium]